MKLYDNTINVLQRAMDLRAERLSVLTSNLANSETPGYRARELNFAGELQRAMGTSSGLVKTDPRHMDIGGLGGGAHIVLDNTAAAAADGNNVDLDLQVGKISENSRIYESAANFLSVKLRLLKDAARGPQGV